MARKIQLTLLFWILAFAPCAWASDPPVTFFFNLGMKDGLPASCVTGMICDADGFMWFSTPKQGISRYDGSRFLRYVNRFKVSSSLSDNYVTGFYLDTHKDIWACTPQGVNRIDYQTGTVSRYLVKSKEKGRVLAANCCLQTKAGHFYVAMEDSVYRYEVQRDSFIVCDSKEFRARDISSMLEDRQENIYVAASAGLYLLDAGWQVKKHFPLVSITSLFMDSQNRLWVTTSASGVYLLNADGTFTRFYTGNSRISSDVTRCLVEYGKKDTLLIGSAAGIDRLDVCTGEITPFSYHTGREGGLTHCSVHCMLIDQQGTLWVGTFAGGVNYLNRHNQRNFTIHHRDFSGYYGPGVEDSEGKMWFATSGIGLVCYDPESNESWNYLIHGGTDVAYDRNTIKSVLLRGDSILCGTNKGEVYLFSRLTRQFRLLYDYKHNDIYSLLVDRAGRLWIPTNSGLGLVGSNRKSSRTFPSLTVITELFSQRLLLGTQERGAVMYDVEKDDFIIYGKEAFGLAEEDRLGEVTAILQDGSQDIWIATFGTGIYCFSPEMKLKRHFFSMTGLPEDQIYSMAQGRDGTLWALTAHALLKLADDRQSFYTYPLDHSAAREFNYMSLTLSDKGNIYLSSNNGVFCFTPLLQKMETLRQPLYITTLEVNNQEVAVGDHSGILSRQLYQSRRVTLDYHQNQVSLGYSALNYVNSTQDRFAYQLVGVDEEWKEVNKQRKAIYSDLNPGNYHFRVRYSSNNGEWSAPTELEVCVLPPWYRTWWAYSLYIFVITGIVFYYFYNQYCRRRLELRLRVQQLEQEQVEYINNERMRLYANFSHELRTPLSLIINPLDELIDRRVFSPEVNRMLAMIKKNTKRLMILINNLMDIQRYESDKVVLNLEDVEVEGVVRAICLEFAPVAKARKIEFAYRLHLPPGLSLSMDKAEMEKVFFNLLSNAFKFTSELGKVEVNIRLCTKNEGRGLAFRNLLQGACLCVEVSDTGCGISEEALRRIFEPFYRSTDESTLRAEGSGIGLSLSRHIISQHGGEIGAQSVVGQGTTICFLLPLGKEVEFDELSPDGGESAQAFPMAQTEHRLLDATDGRRRLLVVDDDYDFRHYIMEQFMNEYVVVVAADGWEALELIGKEVFDLIISDVLMPRLNGLELCKRLKSEPRTALIPVILLTSQALPLQIIQGFEAGADDYLVKPFDINLLRSRLSNLLMGYERMKRSGNKRLDLESLGIQAKSQDAEFLRKYFDVIRFHFSNPNLDVQFICKEIGVSKATLYRKTGALTQLNPADMIRNIRLETAAQLLTDTDFSIQEIMVRIGFTNSSYFSACFKVLYGISPTDYRGQALR